MFSPPTRKGVQQSTIGFGEAVAGRGYDINRAIGKFLPLVSNLLPVDDEPGVAEHRPGRFPPRSGEAFSGALAPVAQTQAIAVHQPQHDVLGAGRRWRRRCRTRSRHTPPAFEAVITQAPMIRPFLTDTASLLTQLKPGIQDARDQRAGAHERVPHRRAEPAGDDPVRPTAGVVLEDDRPLRRARRPSSRASNSLSYTAKHLQQPLAFLTPVQSTCNYVTLFLRNIASATSEHVAQRRLPRLPAAVDPRQPGPQPQLREPAVQQAVHRDRVVTRPDDRLHRAAARQPVPEHGVARSDPGVLGRQRALQPASGPLVGNPPGNVGVGDREDDPGRLELRRRRARISNVAAGAIGDPRDRRDLLGRVRRADPVLRRRLQAQGGLHVPDRVAPRLAGADRRRRRRQGHWDRAHRRQLAGDAGDDVDRQARACRSMPTRPRTSGRGCSWRATTTSTCSRGRRRRRRCRRAPCSARRTTADRCSSTGCCRR